MAATRNASTRRAIPLLMTICLFTIPTQAQFGGGAGEPNDPYLIYTPEQLNAIGADPNHWDKHFKLMADIDMAVYAETGFAAIGRGAVPERNRPGFTGIFDGNSHAISGLEWADATTGPAGLFAYVSGPSGEIKNLTLLAPEMILGEEVCGAPLVAHLDGGAVVNCHVQGGRISGKDAVGGLAAFNEKGRIVDSSVAISIEGSRRVGGLAACNCGDIVGCRAGGSVTGQSQVGGLVGYNEGTITECSADSRITGEMTGGLVGLNEGNILQSHAVGDVNGTSGLGGLVGCHHFGVVENCYATGNVAGERSVGGLVGVSYATVIRCHATGNVTGEHTVGGLAGDSLDTIDECYALGDVFGADYVGGLAGESGYEVRNSYATGSVAGKQSVGGLIGSASSLVENCYATGHVQGVEDVGGLVGDVVGRVVNCFASGDVTGDNRIGGLAGFNGTLHSESSITNCYATGNIHGPVEVNDVPQVTGDPCMPAMLIIRDGGPLRPDTYAGGLVGKNFGSILNSYSIGAVLRARGAGGLVGISGTSSRIVGSFWDLDSSGLTTSASGVGLGTAAMKTASTFVGTGWDFIGETANGVEDVWWILDGKDYPRLFWELP